MNDYDVGDKAYISAFCKELYELGAKYGTEFWTVEAVIYPDEYKYKVKFSQGGEAIIPEKMILFKT